MVLTNITSLVALWNSIELIAMRRLKYLFKLGKLLKNDNAFQDSRHIKKGIELYNKVKFTILDMR